LRRKLDFKKLLTSYLLLLTHLSLLLIDSGNPTAKPRATPIAMPRLIFLIATPIAVPIAVPMAI
jgi:hypothetical protein